MRRVEAFASMRASSRPARPDGPETAEEGFLREGMTNAEGLEALDLDRGGNVSPQVAASTLDLYFVGSPGPWRSRNAGRGRKLVHRNARSRAPRWRYRRQAPRDAIERDLAAIWKEMLGVQQVSIDDDFFELGGQSLIAMRLFNRIRKEHGVELPLSVLFQAPTIAATAALLREAKGLAAIDPSADGADVAMQASAEDQLSAVCTSAAADHVGRRTCHRSERTIIKRSGASPIIGRDHTGRQSTAAVLRPWRRWQRAQLTRPLVGSAP